jgi:hypothetical protein
MPASPTQVFELSLNFGEVGRCGHKSCIGVFIRLLNILLSEPFGDDFGFQVKERLGK